MNRPRDAAHARIVEDAASHPEQKGGACVAAKRHHPPRIRTWKTVFMCLRDAHGTDRISAETAEQEKRLRAVVQPQQFRQRAKQTGMHAAEQ